MNHLYTIIWLRNQDRLKEIQKDLQKENIQNNIEKNIKKNNIEKNIKKNNIQKNEVSNKTPNKIIKKEPQVKKELYNSDDIEKLLLIM
jgi:hypothetical protein